MQERVIVTMTSYGRRINNLPKVIDSIFNQTVQPNLIVLNLAYDEIIPRDVESYLKKQGIEINRVPDTKVYKKLIPTLKKHTEALVISIDDDFLYPPEMIEEFMRIHIKYPNFPISGNKVVYQGMQCHCGCASLTCAKFFGDYLSIIDDAMIKECPSDDILYTFFSTKSGHPYICTESEFFINMESYGEDAETGYSKAINNEIGIDKTYEYLIKRFGPIDTIVESYLNDSYIANIINHIHKNNLLEQELKIRSSYPYRIGKFLFKPFLWLKKIYKA